MMYLHNTLGRWQIENRSSPPRGTWFYPEPDVPWVECYVFFDNGDGSVTPLVSENKLGDKLNRLAKLEYDFTK